MNARKRAKLKARLREWRRQSQSVQLRQLERVRRRMLAGEVDVLVLADSSVMCGSARDTDLRMIPELIGEELPGLRVAVVAGPGFRPTIYAEVLRVLALLEQRPQAVVVSTALRPSLTHVREHPVYKYAEVTDALLAVRTGRRRIRSLGRGSRPGPAEYAAFEALPVTSVWSGTSTIGDFRDAVKGTGPHPWPLEQRLRLFDYFHGEVLDLADPAAAEAVASWTRLGARLRDYGVPAVAYVPTPPFEHGEGLYPGFRDLYEQKWAVFRKALLAEAGDLRVLDIEYPDAEWDNSANATEHYAFAGRQRIAREVAQALRAAGIAERPSTDRPDAR